MLHLTICMLVAFFASVVISSNATVDTFPDKCPDESMEGVIWPSKKEENSTEPSTKARFNCNFEKDLCGFSKNKYQREARMSRIKVRGNYVMLSEEEIGGGAAMSRYIDNQGQPSCLRIKYEVICGRLTFHLIVVDVWQKLRILSTRLSLSPTSGWKTAFMNFTAATETKIELFTFTMSPKVMVAYDDISITDGPCP